MPSFWCKSIKEFWHNDKLLLKALPCEIGMQCIRKKCTSYAFVRGQSQQPCALFKSRKQFTLKTSWPWLHWLWRWLSEKFDNIFKTLIQSYRKQNILVIIKNVSLLSRCFVLLIPNIWMLRNIRNIECVFKVGFGFNVNLCLLSCGHSCIVNIRTWLFYSFNTRTQSQKYIWKRFLSQVESSLISEEIASSCIRDVNKNNTWVSDHYPIKLMFYRRDLAKPGLRITMELKET